MCLFHKWSVAMENQENIILEITLVQETSTLRELEVARADLFNFLDSQLSDQISMTQPVTSRSIDPVVLGTISLAILPIVVEKLADLIIKWIELQKDSSVNIKLPVKGSRSIEVSYNPKTTSPETIKSWIKMAIDSTK